MRDQSTQAEIDRLNDEVSGLTEELRSVHLRAQSFRDEIQALRDADQKSRNENRALRDENRALRDENRALRDENRAYGRKEMDATNELRRLRGHNSRLRAAIDNVYRHISEEHSARKRRAIEPEESTVPPSQELGDPMQPEERLRLVVGQYIPRIGWLPSAASDDFASPSASTLGPRDNQDSYVSSRQAATYNYMNPYQASSVQSGQPAGGFGAESGQRSLSTTSRRGGDRASLGLRPTPPVLFSATSESSRESVDRHLLEAGLSQSRWAPEEIQRSEDQAPMAGIGFPEVQGQQHEQQQGLSYSDALKAKPVVISSIVAANQRSMFAPTPSKTTHVPVQNAPRIPEPPRQPTSTASQTLKLPRHPAFTAPRIPEPPRQPTSSVPPPAPLFSRPIVPLEGSDTSFPRVDVGDDFYAAFAYDSDETEDGEVKPEEPAEAIVLTGSAGAEDSVPDSSTDGKVAPLDEGTLSVEPQDLHQQARENLRERNLDSETTNEPRHFRRRNDEKVEEQPQWQLRPQFRVPSESEESATDDDGEV